MGGAIPMFQIRIRDLVRSVMSGCIAAIALVWLATPADAQVLPQYGKDKHLGVASCAGSTSCSLPMPKTELFDPPNN